MTQRTRRPRLILALLRALLVTFLISLLALAISLFLGILGAVIYGRVEHLAPNFGFVYRNIAAPFAIVVGGIVLVLSLILEVRHYRQTRVLAAIEKAQ
jgi:ABC-type sulfate transport system permease component